LQIEGRSQTKIFEFPRNFVGQNVVCKWGFLDPAELLPSTSDIWIKLWIMWYSFDFVFPIIFSQQIVHSTMHPIWLYHSFWKTLLSFHVLIIKSCRTPVSSRMNIPVFCKWCMLLTSSFVVVQIPSWFWWLYMLYQLLEISCDIKFILIALQLQYL
jgi:hypothetical protein